MRHDLPGARTGGPGGGAALGLDLQQRGAPRAPCAGPQLRRRQRRLGGHDRHGPGGRVNGAPDRYEWQLVGKREVYVPYNTYRLSDKSLKYKDIIGRHTINADLVRYELHRVWVVEGTLKLGQRHVYGRRTFDLDEDSWSVVSEDAYDNRGGLWRVALHGMLQYYDVVVPWYRYGVVHDLTSGGYIAGGFDNEGWRDDPKAGVLKGECFIAN